MHNEISLPLELAEPILVWLLRHSTLPLAQDSSAPIHAPLHVLSRSLAPDVTRAALVKLWWYSVDDIPPGSVSWLLPMLLELEQRTGRPLVYSVAGLGRAARRGDFETLDAWILAGLVSDDDGYVGDLDTLDAWVLAGQLSGQLSNNEGSLYHDARAWSHCAKQLRATLGLDRTTVAQYLAVLEWCMTFPLSWASLHYGQGGPAPLPLDEDLCLAALEWWRSHLPSGAVEPTRILTAASRLGFVCLLDWCWTEYSSSIQCTNSAMNAATEGGHVGVLQWWVDRFPLNSQTATVVMSVANLASRHGHAHVLHWWFDATSGLPKAHRNCVTNSMDQAAAHGHLAVLDFWFSCSVHPHAHERVPLTFEHAVDWASASGHVEVIDWFATHFGTDSLHCKPCPLKNQPDFPHHAQAISIAVLESRRRHGIRNHFSFMGMTLLSRDGRLDVLEWITQNQVHYNVLGPVVDEPLLQASRNGHIQVLDWWLKELGSDKLTRLDVGTHPLVEASRNGHVQVLDWWLKVLGNKKLSNLADEPLVQASRNGQLQVLDWWLGTLGNERFGRLAATVSRLSLTNCVAALQWWADKHIKLPLTNMSGMWFLDKQSQVDSVVKQCVRLCLDKGDYAAIAWCMLKYPSSARKALSGLSIADVQYGVVEFLVQHREFLDPDMSVAGHFLPLSVDNAFGYRVAKKRGLALMDWVHQNVLGPDHREGSQVYALSKDDWDEAEEDGDLGFLRWAKHKQLAVRDE